MATWVTHLIIADGVMKEFVKLDRRGFCVGNIAPDCNVENADWTSYQPPRQVTHWMTGERKCASDCDAFYQQYIEHCINNIRSKEQYSFLLGYYAHLITDAAFQSFIRDEKRNKDLWSRIEADDNLRSKAAGYPRNYDSVKIIIPKKDRIREIGSMEAEYLQAHPSSGYLTEILPLKEFPDYIDYLPHGCIVRKIGIMGYLPQIDPTLTNPIALSKNEFQSFVNDTISLIISKFKDKEVMYSI